MGKVKSSSSLSPGASALAAFITRMLVRIPLRVEGRGGAVLSLTLPSPPSRPKLPLPNNGDEEAKSPTCA